MRIKHKKFQSVYLFREYLANLIVTDRNLFPVQKSKSSKKFLLETLLGTTLQENKDTKKLLDRKSVV